MNFRDGMAEIAGVFRAAYQETARFIAEDVRDGGAQQQDPDGRIKPSPVWSEATGNGDDNVRVRS